MGGKIMLPILFQHNKKVPRDLDPRVRMGVYCILAVFCFLAFAPQAMAVGTAAGTNITNQAYADYKDANGNDLTRVFSNTVTTTVSQVAGVDVLPPTFTEAGANSTTLAYHIEIFNTGNGEDTYSFSYAVDPASDWTPTSVSFYFDVDHSQTYDPAVDTVQLVETSPGSGIYQAVDGTGTPVPIAPDNDYDMHMIVEVPDGVTAPDTTSSIIKVTATSNFDNAQTDLGTFTAIIATAVIFGEKSHTPDIATHAPTPGETVTYKIVLTNSGSTDGTATSVSDPIPNGLTFTPGSIKVDTVTLTDADDGDAADYNITTPNAVTIDVGTVTAGASVTIEFDVTVSAGVASGTAIANQATVTYTSGGNEIVAQTDSDLLFVGTSATFDLTAAATVASGDPGDKITYPITVTNGGNGDDVADITYTSTAGWAWDLWYDANDDGIAGNDGDFLLTDSDGDGVVDTGLIPAGGTAAILATTTIPAGTADGTTDTLVVTGTSSVDTNVTDTTGDLTTTVTAPVLSVSKTVTPTGSQPPGTELTYTVTVSNSGTGVATNVIITDLRPTSTTYTAGSLLTGSSLATLTGRTDAADGDGAEYDTGSHAVVAGNAGTSLGAGGTYILQFKVTID